MSVKPLDLQVNMNSTIHISQREGGKLSRIDSEQRFIDNKAHEQHRKIDEQINKLDHSENSNRVHDEKDTYDRDVLHKKQKDSNREKTRKKRSFSSKNTDRETEYEETNPDKGLNLLA